MPIRGGGGSAVVTVHDPARYALTVFRERLARAGITIDGATRVEETDELEPTRVVPQDEGRVALVTHFSPPLGEVVKVVNKRSQNFYAEQLLKTLGAETRGRGTAGGGIAAIDEFLRREVGSRNARSTGGRSGPPINSAPERDREAPHLPARHPHRANFNRGRRRCDGG